jgi:hypothetical protein
MHQDTLFEDFDGRPVLISSLLCSEIIKTYTPKTAVAETALAITVPESLSSGVKRVSYLS